MTDHQLYRAEAKMWRKAARYFDGSIRSYRRPGKMLFRRMMGRFQSYAPGLPWPGRDAGVLFCLFLALEAEDDARAEPCPRPRGAASEGSAR